MKKNLIIGFLTILTILSLSFGYYQKERADAQEALAIKNTKLAEHALETAQRNREEAPKQLDRAVEAAKQAQTDAAKNFEASQKASETK